MSRYIDADKINAKLMDEYHGMISDESMKIYKIMQMLDNAPTADVYEVRHAKFELIDNGKGVCSNCYRLDYIDNLAKYCRYCGAKIDLEEKEK